MTYDFETDIRAKRAEVGRLRREFGRGVEELRGSTDFAVRAADLAGRLESVFGKLPEPEQPPPKTETTLTVPDFEKPPQSVLQRPERWLGRLKELLQTLIGIAPPLEAYLRKPVKIERTEKVPLREPMYPGSPKQEVSQEFDVFKVVRGAPRPETWAERVRASWQRLRGRGVPDQDYEHRLQPDRRLVTKTVEIPLPEEPVANALVRRRNELADEVRDIDLFVRTYEESGGEIAARTAELESAAEDLQRKTEGLADLPDYAARLEAVRRDMQAVSDALPEKAMRVDELEKRLRELEGGAA